MPVFARMIFGLVNFAARKGLRNDAASARQQARQTGIRGARTSTRRSRRGYVMIARNFIVPGIKGEIDLVGYDGPVLAFIEVKTRAAASEAFGKPEEAVTTEKRRHLSRMARHFLTERRIAEATCRFNVLAIESRPGRRPVVRLHRGAFGAAD